MNSIAIIADIISSKKYIEEYDEVIKRELTSLSIKYKDNLLTSKD